MSEAVDKIFRQMDKPLWPKLEYPKEKNANQRLAGIEHEARQSRLATEEDTELTRRLASARRAPLKQIKRSISG